MKKLGDYFDDNSINHFTYYDYVKQCIMCGNWKSLTETLNELDNGALFVLIRNLESNRALNQVEAVLIERLQNA